MRHYLLILGLWLAMIVPAEAAHVQEITSRGGIKAWLVEEHKLPLLAMHFAFRGGMEQDPANKQGLAQLAMGMLAEGAGPYDAASFQQELANHSIALSFGVERDSLQGSLKALSADRQAAFDLLAAALTQPHIDAKDFDRVRGEQLSRIREQLGNPGWQGRYALFQDIFAHHPYGQRHLGTVKTLSSLTAEDVKTFIATHLAEDNLVVTVAGDITPSELSLLLDQTFGKLPRHARLTKITEVEWPKNPASILIPRAGTQTELMFAMPGPKQNAPDWYAANIANYILGGGGFSSRLMQDVRDKKGLTYGIDMELAPAEHGGMIIGEAATDNPKTKEAWDIVQSTMRRFYDDGVTEKEIAGAKDFLTGSLPLSLTSTDRIAQFMNELQLEHYPANYLDKRNDLIRKVTPDQVQAAIQRWFNPDHLTLSMVGKPEGMPSTQTRELVRE